MIPDLWILFAFAATICWGIGDFLTQRETRKVGDKEALAFIGLVGSLILLPFVWKEIPLLFVWDNFWLLLLTGVITFASAMLFFEALKRGKLCVIEVVMELELPITMALGIFVLGEALTFLQFGLIAVIFLGILLIAFCSFSPKDFLKKIEHGVIFALIGAMGMGFLNFFVAEASRKISPLMAIWFPWVTFATISFLFLWKEKRLHKTISDAIKFKPIIIVTGIIATMAWVFFSFALNSNELAITTAITESYPAISLILGVLLNKENISKHQLLGAAIALVACIALAISA